MDNLTVLARSRPMEGSYEGLAELIERVASLTDFARLPKPQPHVAASCRAPEYGEGSLTLRYDH